MIDMGDDGQVLGGLSATCLCLSIWDSAVAVGTNGLALVFARSTAAKEPDILVSFCLGLC